MTKGCGCDKEQAGKGCGGCDAILERYWCETCNRAVAEKRCPFCGLKTKGIRQSDGK